MAGGRKQVRRVIRRGRSPARGGRRGGSPGGARHGNQRPAGSSTVTGMGAAVESTARWSPAGSGSHSKGG